MKHRVKRLGVGLVARKRRRHGTAYGALWSIERGYRGRSRKWARRRSKQAVRMLQVFGRDTLSMEWIVDADTAIRLRMAGVKDVMDRVDGVDVTIAARGGDEER